MQKKNPCKIFELHYDRTNTYLICGEKGILLFDTGWAGTLPKFFQTLGELQVDITEIRYLLISHFHPDHMGIAQEISDLGVPILLVESQKRFVHVPDLIYQKDKRLSFSPVKEERCISVTFAESRSKLEELGLYGEIIETPGHSEDSVSLILDEGVAFVGDLPPLYELPLQEGEVRRSWERILSYRPKRIYYGHAKTAELPENFEYRNAFSEKHQDPLFLGMRKRNDSKYNMIKRIIKWSDQGMRIEKIAKKLLVDREFVEDVCRMYLTHPGVSIQGILDRIEIKGK